MAKQPIPRRAPTAADQPTVAGWREWVGLPDLGVAALKAKLDTGARTSAIHAFDLDRFEKSGAPWVRFVLHPRQRKATPVVSCEARVIDERSIRSSTGHTSHRPVIETALSMGARTWRIELTLAARDEMGFRLLLGRQALRGRCLIDPRRSYLIGKAPRKRPAQPGERRSS